METKKNFGIFLRFFCCVRCHMRERETKHRGRALTVKILHGIASITHLVLVISNTRTTARNFFPFLILISTPFIWSIMGLNDSIAFNWCFGGRRKSDYHNNNNTSRSIDFPRRQWFSFWLTWYFPAWERTN